MVEQSLPEMMRDQRPLVVHAHPDDEVLSTGVLLAYLAERRIPCGVVTCTRGERGEIVPGTVPEGMETEELARIRQQESAAALRELAGDGRIEHYWLGTAPARTEGERARVYVDSGMRWVTPTQAGPAETSDERAFALSEIDDEIADLVAVVQSSGATMLISYDENGTYGHPDHIRAHEITRAAAQRTDLPFLVIHHDAEALPGGTTFALPQFEQQIRRALGHYRTQLQVEGAEVVHVGGQRTALPLAITMRYEEVNA